jgi:hypothetical protein
MIPGQRKAAVKETRVHDINILLQKQHCNVAKCCESTKPHMYGTPQRFCTFSIVRVPTGVHVVAHTWISRRMLEPRH